MSEPTLLAIDQGTSSSRAILFSREGKIIAQRQKELALYYPDKGWVEQNPEDLWNDTLWACRAVLEDAPGEADRIAAIGITNQRETTILWDRDTGKPVYNAIVWQDRRTADMCEEYRIAGHEPRVSERTGLILDPYFSATKIAWILDHVDGLRERAAVGEIAFGTVDCFLVWRLTGGKIHVTDACNASRTMLFDIVRQQWDEELLELFNVPADILPEVKDNASEFGETEASLLGRSIPIRGMAGDQHAALVGQACFEIGMVKSTYGTGCFALTNIGPAFKQSQNHLLTTTGYRLGGEISYAIEGSIFVAGAAVQWLRDNLGLFKNAEESEDLAQSVEDTNGVYFVPAFTGLGAPYWRPDARAAITGLTRESNAAHITRAALEAQAYQTLDLMEAMQADSGAKLELIRADGGLMSNELVAQFLADMLNKTVEIPEVTETTAYGAACLAGLQAGIYRDLDDISANWRAERRYSPEMDEGSRSSLYAGWKKAIGSLL